MRDNKIHPATVRRPKVAGGSSLRSLSHTVAPGKERSTNVVGKETHPGGGLLTACECMILRRIELLVSVKRYLRACISCNCLNIYLFMAVYKNVIVHLWRTENYLQRSLFFFHASSRENPSSPVWQEP